MSRFIAFVVFFALIALFLPTEPVAAQVHVDFNYCPGHAVYAPVPVYHPPVPVYYPQPTYVYRGGYPAYHHGHHGHYYHPPVVHHYHGMSPGAEIASGVIQVLDGVLRSNH